jgi:hypothetical protein
MMKNGFNNWWHANFAFKIRILVLHAHTNVRSTKR